MASAKKTAPAARKKTPPPDLAQQLAAAPYPKDAIGLGRAKGLGTSPEVDAWLGLGFPFVIIPIGEPDASGPPLTTVGAFTKRYPLDAAVMPSSSVAQQLAISTAWPPLEATNPLPPIPKPKVASAVADALAEQSGRVILQLEALFGTLAVTEAVVGAIVRASERGALAKIERGGSATLNAALPWMLMRLPRADAERLRASLRAVFDRGATTYSFHRALDVMLNGRAGVERSGGNANGRIHLAVLAHAHDDAAWARTTAIENLTRLQPADREWFSPQLAVLGGPELVEAFRKSIDKFMVVHRPAMISALALFR